MPDKLQIKTLEKHDVQYMIINEEFEYLDFSLEDYRDMFDELKNVYPAKNDTANTNPHPNSIIK